MATYGFDSSYDFSGNPFSNNGSNNYNFGSVKSGSLDDLTNQWNNYVNNVNNNNFAGSLPKFNYDPKTGDTDVTNKNNTYRQQNREDLVFNQNLNDQDANTKKHLNSTVDLETRTRNLSDYQQKIMMDNQKAIAEQEKNRPRTQTFSYSSTVDPMSIEGQKIANWKLSDARANAYGQGLMNDVEVAKQSRLIPMQTQATIQTQAPQFESQQKVTDIQAQAQKAVAEANAKAQMYGANLNAMSSMFGSQMGAVGNMFGGMSGGGGARYW